MVMLSLVMLFNSMNNPVVSDTYTCLLFITLLHIISKMQILLCQII
jgi:hypothetical protein